MLNSRIPIKSGSEVKTLEKSTSKSNRSKSEIRTLGSKSNRSRSDIAFDTLKVKIGVIGGLENENAEILKTNRIKTLRVTPFGKPSDDLVFGKVEGVECVFMSRRGRKNDIMPSKINYRANIWALKEEGCTHILSTVIGGILAPDLKVGDFLVLRSFIDETVDRDSTFFDGEKNHPQGVCLLPTEPAFCETTRRLIIQTARNLEIPVHEKGTVIVVDGPRLLTKPEKNMFAKWGADVYNMTLVPEAILAKELGICYATVALAIDYEAESENETRGFISTIKKQSAKMNKLINGTIKNIAKENWDQVFEALQNVVQNSVIVE